MSQYYTLFAISKTGHPNYQHIKLYGTLLEYLLPEIKNINNKK